jgi:peptidoglycan/LPS O-acetylase OafA/YrhL
MKTAFSILLVILTLLAVLSGATKIALMPQDVEFFGRYGFSGTMVIAFGAAQLVGGIMMPWKKTRFVGAAIVAITFIVSLVLLLLDGNIPVSAVTTIATLLLFVIMKQSWQPEAKGG